MRAALSSLLLALPLLAHAHSSSQSFLRLQGDERETTLQVDVALRDLDLALDLDRDGDGNLSWGEVRKARDEIVDWTRAGLRLQGCDAAWKLQDFGLEERNDGVYASMRLQADCALPADPRLHYALMLGLDPTHRALLRGPDGRLHLLSAQALPARVVSPPDATTSEVPAASATATAAPAIAVQEPALWQSGIEHILSGYDHLLFLLCLILPAVLRRRDECWLPVQRLREALLPILGIVSAFTLAHSVTLGLAALGWVRIAPAVIEPLIAFSIVIAALDNLRPFLSRLLWNAPRWSIAFAFGLIHGFGFADALAELELPPAEFAWALLRFNLGLECGQLVVVGGAVALLYGLRRWTAYPRWVLGLGSSLAAVLGSFWMVQRLA